MTERRINPNFQPKQETQLPLLSKLLEMLTTYENSGITEDFKKAQGFLEAMILIEQSKTSTVKTAPISRTLKGQTDNVEHDGNITVRG